MGIDFPSKIENSKMRFDAFGNGEVLPGKKTGRLPAMGWNSWNAFGSGNTEALTRAMSDCIVALGLDKLGYKYVVLDSMSKYTAALKLYEKTGFKYISRFNDNIYADVFMKLEL